MAPANKGKKYPAEVLTRVEVNLLLAACSNRGPSGIRNCALISTLYRSGLRVAEVLALQVKDVDFDERTIAVLHGKGDRARSVSIDPAGIALIERWLHKRGELTLPRSAPLFCTISRPNPGRPLWDSYVREMLKDAAGKAGLEKRVHPHGLRHTMAYELLREGLPLPLIQRQLGHRELSTTARYIDHFPSRALIDAMGSRPDWLEAGG